MDIKKHFSKGIIANSLKSEMSNSPLLLHYLKDYPKFRSIICLNALKLPISDGILLWSLNSYVYSQINKFIEKQNSQKYLIRTETQGYRLFSPSRADIPPNKVIHNIKEIKAKYPNAIILIQTIDSLYRNLYNINIRLNAPFNRRYIFDIVGPGFNAPDLNRQGILHEVVEIPTFILSPDEALIRRTYVVSDKDYQYQRCQKISTLGKNHLSQENSLLLEKPTYTPIGIEFLKILWEDIDKLKLARDWLGIKYESAIISVGFIESGTQIVRSYWDIHADIDL